MGEIDYGVVFGIDMAEADMQGEKETEIVEPDNTADGGTETKAPEEKPEAEVNAGSAAARRSAEQEAEDYVSKVFKVTGAPVALAILHDLNCNSVKWIKLKNVKEVEND